MAALRRLAAILLFLAEAPALGWCGAADGVSRWQSLVADASARTGLPAGWIAEVMRAESCGQVGLGGRPTVSRAGAMGLMQLMPGTWQELRVRLRLGDDPHDPRDNILAGAAYLRLMYDRFGYPGLFAAYNAGPARYAAHLASGRPLSEETRLYLARVTGRAGVSATTVPPGRRPLLFAVRWERPADASDGASTPAGAPVRDPLFVVRSPR